MNMYDGPFWGMHLFWWAFWIIAMVSVFGFNVPERAGINSLDPQMILKRRLAKGDLTEAEYEKISAQLRTHEALVLREANAQSARSKLGGHPMIDGLSFSATWALFYSSCAALFVIAPAAMIAATSQLFHGMNFTQMAQTGSPFTFGDFLSTLTIGAVYTFAAGVIWSLTHSYFLRLSGERSLKRIENSTIQKAQLTPQPR